MGPIRALRLSYTLGIGLASLVALPFLWQKSSTERPSYSVPLEDDGHHCRSPMENNSSLLETEGKTLTHVQAAYFVIALTGFLLSMLFFCLPLKRTSGSYILTRTQEDAEPHTENCHHLLETYSMSYYKMAIFLIFMIFTALFGGAEITFTGLLISYSYDFLGWGKKEAIIMSALYQMVKFIFAVVAILLSYKFPSSLILFGNVIVVTVTSGFLLRYVTCEYHTSMWVCTLCLAIGNSSLFPSCLSWIGQKERLWRRLPRLFNMSFCIGVIILPYLTAHLLVTYGYKYLPWVLLVSSSIGSLMYFLLLTLLEFWPYLLSKRTGEETESLLQCKPEHPVMWAV